MTLGADARGGRRRRVSEAVFQTLGERIRELPITPQKLI
jgi:hypothetical protein